MVEQMVLNCLLKDYPVLIFLQVDIIFMVRYEYVPLESILKATAVIIGIAEKVSDKYKALTLVYCSCGIALNLML